MKLTKNGYLYHFLFGVIAAMLVYKFGFYWSWILGISIGVGKEIYDKLSKKGTPELYDFLSTMAGVVIGVALEAITDKIFEWLN